MLEPGSANSLRTGLRSAAQRELACFGGADPATDDGGYASALRRLVDATESPRET